MFAYVYNIYLLCIVNLVDWTMYKPLSSKVRCDAKFVTSKYSRTPAGSKYEARPSYIFILSF